MTKPIVKIVNVETGEEIEREMNAAEYKQWQIDQDAESQRQIEIANKNAKRQELLDKLGITGEEAKLLLG